MSIACVAPETLLASWLVPEATVCVVREISCVAADCCRTADEIEFVAARTCSMADATLLIDCTACLVDS